MIFENISGNLTMVNLNNCFDFTGKAMKTTPECISRAVCSSLDSYYVRYGIVLIISWIVVNWGSWWFLNYGYKKGEGTKHLTEIERANIMIRIKFLQTLVYIMYITVVVIMNWK